MMRLLLLALLLSGARPSVLTYHADYRPHTNFYTATVYLEGQTVAEYRHWKPGPYEHRNQHAMGDGIELNTTLTEAVYNATVGFYARHSPHHLATPALLELMYECAWDSEGNITVFLDVAILNGEQYLNTLDKKRNAVMVRHCAYWYGVEHKLVVVPVLRKRNKWKDLKITAVRKQITSNVFQCTAARVYPFNATLNWLYYEPRNAVIYSLPTTPGLHGSYVLRSVLVTNMYKPDNLACYVAMGSEALSTAYYTTNKSAVQYGKFKERYFAELKAEIAEGNEGAGCSRTPYKDLYIMIALFVPLICFIVINHLYKFSRRN